MKKNLLIGHKKIQYFTLITSLLMLTFLKGISQVSLTTMGAAYTQNFDALANSGTSSSVPTGWVFSEAGGNTLYTAGTGSSATGDTYSFGSSSASDRAFGTLLSGSVNSTLGASFINGTGSTITSLNVSYIGEQWRLGATARVDRLNFEYSLDATSLTTGSWTAVTALNFVAPITTAPTGTLDGNLSANRTSISSNIGSLSIAVGSTVWIRWTDFNATSSDDGLAIDDFSLTPNGSAPVPPTKLVITSITPSSPIAGSGFNITVQAQDVTNTAQNVLANTAFALTTNGNAGVIGGTLVGTINAGSNSVVVSGVTLATAGTNVNLTATRTSGDILLAATSPTFDVIGIATQLAFVGVPSSGYISTNMAAFTVEARRADNSIDVNYTGNITISKASGPGTLSGTTVVAAVAGVATFSLLQFDQVGTYSLNTSASGLTSATSSAIVISASPVMWDFTTASPTGVPANLTVSAMSQGNNNGTTPLISSTSSSSGYTGASGTFNAGAAARTGAINTGASGSAYFEFTLTPDPNYIVTLNGLSFGSRSTGTGPAAFSIRSSENNFVSNIGTGSLLTSGAWALSNPSISSTSSNAGSGITFRIYGHNGTGSPGANTANWRIDDVLLNLSVTACTQPNISVNSGSICAGNSFTINPTGGLTYSITGSNFTVSPTANTDYTVTGADAIGCTNTAVSSVVVNALPVISINANPASVCSGSSSTLTANGGSSYTWNTGESTASIIVNPSVNTDYTVTGTNGIGCVNMASLTLTVNNCPGSVLTGTSCNASLTMLDQALYFSKVPGATNYRLEITNAAQSFIAINVRGNTQGTFKMSQIQGIQYGRTYNIRVSAYLGGVWQSYGNTCTVTTPLLSSVTPPQLILCGTTLTSLSDNINFTTIFGATNYKLEITNAAQSFTTVNIRGNTQGTFKMSQIVGVQYGRTYDVRVSAYINGSWQAYGNICSVTTPATIPTTQLSAGSCGITTSAINEILYFDAVSGASNYRVEVINSSQPLNIVNVRNNNNTIFNLAYIQGIQLGTTYDIRVAANVGGIWAAYGPICKVTPTSSSSSRFALSDYDEPEEIGNSIHVNAYPNPTIETLNIDFDNIPSNASVEIYNMIGELVLSQTLSDLNNTINTNELRSGLYHVKVIGNNKLLFAQKIIKQ